MLRRASWLGQAIHKAAAEARSFAHPTWLVEYPVLVPGMERPGTVDAYMDDLANVDDIKTKSGRGFDAILSRGKAYDYDVEQVEIYAVGLENEGHEVRTCSVTYIDRNGHEDPFTDSWTYDRERGLAALGRLHALQDALDDGDELPRQGRGPGLGRPCDSCAWIKTCWQLDSVPEGYSAQSAYLATDEVAEAAAALAALRAEAKLLDEAEAFYKAQLVGHTGATFTDAEGITRQVKWVGGGRTGGPLDSKAVRSHYADLGAEPPTLGTSPQLRLPAVK